MSDTIFTRLRALLGTSGVDRDARGVARASPDSSDALSVASTFASNGPTTRTSIGDTRAWVAAS